VIEKQPQKVFLRPQMIWQGDREGLLIPFLEVIIHSVGRCAATIVFLTGTTTTTTTTTTPTFKGGRDNGRRTGNSYDQPLKPVTHLRVGTLYGLSLPGVLIPANDPQCCLRNGRLSMIDNSHPLVSQ